MVVVQLPTGSTAEYELDDSDGGLRLVSRYASFDLMTALNEMGWRILDITTDRERERVASPRRLRHARHLLKVPRLRLDRRAGHRP
jgi:hypothetical protein